MDQRHPPAEVVVDAALARRLLESQCPEALGGDITLVGEGWDNFIFRVGTEYGLRIPRRQVAVELLRNEQRWLPEIAARLSIAVPVPISTGTPSALFGWPWSVVAWIEGTTAERAPLSVPSAVLLASALRALHTPAPEEAPANPYRGVPLLERAEVIEERVERLHLDSLLPQWRSALGAEPSRTPVWLHGDLHPRNVLVRDDALVGLIDWGDMTGGDPSTDLACAWTLCDPDARSALRDTYGPTDHEWARAIGWAIHFGAALVDSGERAHVAMGRRILDRVGTEL